MTDERRGIKAASEEAWKSIEIRFRIAGSAVPLQPTSPSAEICAFGLHERFTTISGPSAAIDPDDDDPPLHLLSAMFFLESDMNSRVVASMFKPLSPIILIDVKEASPEVEG